MEAVESQNVNTVNLLLELGANPRSESDSGATPLNLAEEYYLHFGPSDELATFERREKVASWEVLTAVKNALETSNRREIETVNPSIPSAMDALATSSGNKALAMHPYPLHGPPPKMPENSSAALAFGNAFGRMEILPPNYVDVSTLIASSKAVDD